MKKTDEENYLELNKTSWNKRTEVHYDSAFYDNATFVNGRTSLNAIELAFLGDMKGKKVLHLQCHFGHHIFEVDAQTQQQFLGAKI